MKNYSEALTVLNGRESKKLENNTYLHKNEDGSIGVRLHKTDVVTYYSDGRTVLNSGGWRTKTTRDRINIYSPAVVSQIKGIWYLDGGKLYRDGVTVFSDGRTDAKEQTKTDIKKILALKKKIKNYSVEFIDALLAGKVAFPTAGDCWFCVLKTDDGQTLGNATKNTDHFDAHMKDKYYVPSLLCQALEHGTSIAVKQSAYAYMHGQPEKAYSHERSSFVFTQMETAIYKFIKRGYGMAA